MPRKFGITIPTIIPAFRIDRRSPILMVAIGRGETRLKTTDYDTGCLDRVTDTSANAVLPSPVIQ
jgi:hypothetical protein